RRHQGELVAAPGTECSGEWMLPGDAKEGHRNQVWIPAPEGGPRGAAPRAKTSTMIIRPPQHGHGGRRSVVGSGSAGAGGGANCAHGGAINCLARAMLALQLAVASSP